MYANAVQGAKAFEHTCPVANVNCRQISGLRASTSSASQFAGHRVAFRAQKCKASRKAATLSVRAVKDGAVLDRPLRVAVVGGGPSGACTAETLAKAGIETYLLERKMDNCKVRFVSRSEAAVMDWCHSILIPLGCTCMSTNIRFVLQPCGGAIPLCMIDEFDLPADIIDRKVTKMKMISPSNREVDVGKTLSETEYIGMCRREVMDDFLRQRAKKNGATVINSLFMKFERPQGEEGPYKLHFNNYDAGGKVGKPDSIEVSSSYKAISIGSSTVPRSML